MPRGNEMILNAVRGRLHSRIDETKHLWQVSYNGRFVTSLRQLPNGYFHSGSDIFARMDIEQAATSAFKLQKLPSRTVPVLA